MCRSWLAISCLFLDSDRRWILQIYILLVGLLQHLDLLDVDALLAIARHFEVLEVDAVSIDLVDGVNTSVCLLASIEAIARVPLRGLDNSGCQAALLGLRC